jgi:hypothetical protein
MLKIKGIKLYREASNISKNNPESPEIIPCDCGHGSTAIRKDHALENALRENPPVLIFYRFK